MRLRLHTSDRAPYWIIGNPALNERTEMGTSMRERVQVTRNQQILSGAEWEGILGIDRRNQRVVLSADVRREFADEMARMDFITSLAALNESDQEHRWEGDVWLRIDKPGTNEFREWLMKDSVIGITGTEMQGTVGLVISYAVSLGGFTGETRSGESESLLLIGSDPDSLGVTLSVATLDALMSPFTPSDTEYFRFVISGTQTNGDGYGTESKLYPAGGSTPADPDAFELPLSTCLPDALDYMLPTVILPGVVTADVTGGDLTVTAPYPGPLSSLYVEIYRNWLDEEENPQEELTFSQALDVIQGTDYRIIGTTGSTDYQLTGLYET
jgi:hypothetical protein